MPCSVQIEGLSFFFHRSSANFPLFSFESPRGIIVLYTTQAVQLPASRLLFLSRPGCVPCVLLKWQFNERNNLCQIREGKVWPAIDTFIVSLYRHMHKGESSPWIYQAINVYSCTLNSKCSWIAIEIGQAVWRPWQTCRTLWWRCCTSTADTFCSEIAHGMCASKKCRKLAYRSRNSNTFKQTQKTKL